MKRVRGILIRQRNILDSTEQHESVDRKMLRGTVVAIFGLCLVALVYGRPQSQNPWLQSTDGGFRVNFGGFHAQVGRRANADGTQAGGGYDVSAGTPWGARAGAGLQGLLNPSNTNGNLYSYATPGDGRPPVRAGLGGGLGGNPASNNLPWGNIYADRQG